MEMIRARLQTRVCYEPAALAILGLKVVCDYPKFLNGLRRNRGYCTLSFGPAATLPNIVVVKSFQEEVAHPRAGSVNRGAAARAGHVAWSDSRHQVNESVLVSNLKRQVLPNCPINELRDLGLRGRHQLRPPSYSHPLPTTSDS